MTASGRAPRIVLFLRFAPDSSGRHGGVHRSYQVWWDCTQVFASENVTVVPYRKPAREWTMAPGRIWARLQLARRNPFALAFATQTARDMARAESDSPALDDYRRYLHDQGPPALCIVEDVVWFRGVVSTNVGLGIPTWACPQNIESLDFEGDLPFGRGGRMLARLRDLANELEALAECQARFAISRVEAGLVSGVGLDTCWYAYRPVGAIRQYFLSVRAAREGGTVDPSLFLLLGSAGRATRAGAMAWVVQHAAAGGLPHGARLEIVGRNTQDLPGVRDLPARCRAHGWVDEPQLTDLLKRARAVLVPQFSGFGAMTRLTEAALAGIPALTTAPAEYAAGPVNGTRALPQRWDRWAEAIADLMRSMSPAAPQTWADSGPAAVLQDALRRYVDPDDLAVASSTRRETEVDVR